MDKGMIDKLDDLETHIKSYKDPAYFAENILDIESLYPRQKFILRKFYGIPWNPDYDLFEDEKKVDDTKYRDLVLVAGRRSGKTFTASIIALYEAYRLLMMQNPAKKFNLGNNQRIYIMNVAKSEKQARETVFEQIEQNFEASDFFLDQNYKRLSKEIRFKDKNVIIETTHSNSNSLVGRTAKAVILDELARFSESGRTSAKEVYQAMANSTKTFGKDGSVVSISSPMSYDDFLMEIYRDSFNEPNVLGLRYPTWIMNPNIERSDLDQDFRLDPQTARREWAAKPTRGESPFFKKTNKINEAIDPEMNNQPPSDPLESERYVLAGDPAQKNDNFGLCLAHRDKNRFVVDYLHAFEPGPDGEIDSNYVSETILRIVDTVMPDLVVFDVSWWVETQQKIKNDYGISVETNVVKRKEYDALKEQFYKDNITIPKHDLTTKELKDLQLVTNRKVDHPSNSSKDVSDALANAVYHLVEGRKKKKSKPMAKIAKLGGK